MGDDGDGGDAKKSRGVAGTSAARAICCALLLLIVLAGIIALVLYLVYRPSKPRFTVVGAAVSDLNATSPSAPATYVVAGMQFTLAVQNPGKRSPIFYDRLGSAVLYRGQAITPPSPLPPLYQEEDSTVTMSVVVGGEAVPVSAETARGLLADRAYGLVPVRFVLLGKIKYKAGPFRSAWIGLYVRCDLLVGAKKGNYGQVPLLGATQCSVDT